MILFGTSRISYEVLLFRLSMIHPKTTCWYLHTSHVCVCVCVREREREREREWVCGYSQTQNKSNRTPKLWKKSHVFFRLNALFPLPPPKHFFFLFSKLNNSFCFFLQGRKEISFLSHNEQLLGFVLTKSHLAIVLHRQQLWTIHI